MIGELLGRARTAGVLAAVDVQVATTVCRLAGERDPWVAMAAALAMRAPRFGHVGVDVATVPGSFDGELDPLDDAVADDRRRAAIAALGWPAVSDWLSRVRQSPLVSGPVPVLAVHGSSVLLERSDAAERRVATALVERAQRPGGSPAEGHGADGVAAAGEEAEVDAILERLLPGPSGARQRDAVRRAADRSLTVLTGGPGTGKTTTVAALLAVLIRRGGARRLALAAPTGKAAARLGEAFRAAAGRLPAELAAELGAAEATTVHRLIGMSHRHGRVHVRHHAGRPLPYDVVIVDEMSMVSLPLMDRLLAALGPQTRLVLVGDPGQLVSVEAGSVLAAVVGPLATATDDAAVDEVLRAVSGAAVAAPLAEQVTVLTASHRFGPDSQLGMFAASVRRGDVETARAVLGATDRQPEGRAGIAWLATDADAGAVDEALRAAVLPMTIEICRAAADGRALDAVGALERARVLCAHRLGRAGVAAWNARIEHWLSASPAGVLGSTRGWYPGRPVLVTTNDYRLGRFNGDLGVVVLVDGRTMVAFAASDADGRPTVELVSPSRLGPVETVHAMTIHKSQGSEFDHVVVLLPPVGSRLASRELLYTAVTRARRQVTLVGPEAALVEAVERGVQRQSTLGERLWGAALRVPTAPR